MATPPPISGDVGGIIRFRRPFGPQYLCARVDPGDAVAESDESNNVTCVAMTSCGRLDQTLFGDCHLARR